MSEITEQRKHPRYEVTAFVDSSGSEVFLHHKLLNLSLGGLSFQCDAPEPIGTEVDLLLHFPEINASLPIRGQVVWANRSQPSDMGLRFIQVDDKKQETLKQYLNKVFQASESKPVV
jgi:uncharacterized protein (TIGR02266 family)